MKILLADPFACTPQFQGAVSKLDASLIAKTWQSGEDPNADILVAWQLPDDYPPIPASVAALFCFGAGINQLLSDHRVPAELPILRLLDEGQASFMADYVVGAAYSHLIGFPRYTLAKSEQKWSFSTNPRRHASAMTVTVLGTGFIGSRVAQKLTEHGFQVRHWSRKRKDAPGIQGFHGWDCLEEAARDADLLVNVLALSPETERIIDARLLNAVASGAALVNIGRGGHVHDDELREALDRDQISHAWLDSFETEPLPRSNWLWAHPKITVTPHIAGPPDIEGAAASLVRAVQAIKQGKAVPGIVRGSV